MPRRRGPVIYFTELREQVDAARQPLAKSRTDFGCRILSIGAPGIKRAYAVAKPRHRTKRLAALDHYVPQFALREQVQSRSAWPS